MSKQFWAILAVIVLLFVGIVAFTGKKDNTASTSSGQPTNHVEGTNTTGVKLVEYGDYECPVCGLYYSAVKQVAANYNDKIAFQFRNLPLTSIHPNAFAGARAAEAAGDQGKYWQMHDLLYENQTPGAVQAPRALSSFPTRSNWAWTSHSSIRITPQTRPTAPSMPTWPRSTRRATKRPPRLSTSTARKLTLPA